MLNMTTAFGRNGLQDWLIQRISAVILSIYSLTLFTFWIFFSKSSTIAWSDFLSSPVMRYATLLTLLSLLLHAWIGMWIIFTDYIKIAILRMIAQTLVYCLLLFYFIWAIQILWG